MNDYPDLNKGSDDASVKGMDIGQGSSLGESVQTQNPQGSVNSEVQPNGTNQNNLSQGVLGTQTLLQSSTQPQLLVDGKPVATSTQGTVAGVSTPVAKPHIGPILGISVVLFVVGLAVLGYMFLKDAKSYR